MTALSTAQPSLFSAPAPAAPTLRPYQVRAVNEILACIQRKRHPLFECATGSGKSVVLAAVCGIVVAHGYETWLFAHRRELIRQLSDHLRAVGLPHGIIAPDEPLTSDPVQVASIDTVRSRYDALRGRMERVRLLVVDECFPAGTLVDGRPIETIGIGDAVCSFHEETGEAVTRQVTATMRRKTSEIAKVTFDDGRSLVCTKNHPLFTEGGWIAAGDALQGLGVFVRPVHAMRRVNELPQKVAIRSVEENRPCFLWDRLHAGVDASRELGSDVANEPALRLGPDESAQPHDQARRSGENACQLSEDRSPATPTGRKWARNDSASSDAFGRTCRRLDGRIRGSGATGSAERLADALQNRHCESSQNGRDRGGRCESLRPATPSRRKEGCLSEIVRVVSVEVHEQGRSDEFERLCPGGLVFNLEVKDTHTYFANNIAVHNCHHVMAASYRLVMDGCANAVRLGTTASPYRYDGKPLGDLFNEAVRGPSPADLERMGYIAPVDVIAPPAKVNLAGVRKRMGDFVAAQLERVVNTDEVTQAAILAYAKHCAGIPTIAYCTTVKHAEDCAAAFATAGWSVEVIEGRMKKADRDRAIVGLARGRHQILFSIDCISEGLDVPVVGAGLMLRPTASTGLNLQQIGRIRRLYPGKDRAVLLDLVGNWTRHGLPNADRPWSLKENVKGLERAVAAVRRCGGCHHVTERGPARCPHCDRKYPVRVIRPGAPSEAALAAMPGLAGMSALKIASMSLGALLPLAKSRTDLEIIAAIKNYKRGWVDHVVRERSYFGQART